MEVFSLTALEIVQKTLTQEITAEEYVNAAFDRIAEVEEKVRAFVTLSKGSALKKAREVDLRVRKGAKVGRLAGVPVAVKDNICTKGLRTTCSSKMLEQFVPPYDATVVERINAEDGIVVGKTNMDEFAMGSSTETSYFGPTRNPWDPSRVPGGSSGGSAAAVAAGESPLALGSDTGGSIRCPASFCNVFGLKPTYGLVSRYGLIAYANSLEQIGPVAKNTYDCALLLSVIAGYDERDSTSINVEPLDTKSLTSSLKGLRVGVPLELLGEGTDRKIAESIFNCASKLEELGATWEETNLPTLSYALPAYYIIAMSEASSNLARFDGVRYGHRVAEEFSDWNRVFSRNRSEGFGPEVKRRIILGTYALSAGYYDRFFLKSVKAVTLIRRDFEEAFKKYDVLLGPTMPIPAFKIGERINDPLALYMCDVDTVPANLAGLPAMSFPCGFCGGLPVGAQVMGPPFHEDLVLRVSYAFEQNTTFSRMEPKL